MIKFTAYGLGTGHAIDLESFDEDDVDILDIAHGLACVNRFCGSVRDPITVAQHSVYVAQLCPREHALQGLLHDAAEAYVGDMTKWLKDRPEMAWYRELEDKVLAAIMDHHDLPRQLHQTVLDADRLMVRYEMERSGWKLDDSRGAGYGPTTLDERRRVGYWTPLPWQAAQQEFLQTYEELYSGGD